MAPCSISLSAFMLVSVVTSGLIQSTTSTITEGNFTKRTAWCDLQPSCFNSVAQVRSKVECLILCCQNASCNFALYLPSDGSCLTNYECPRDETSVCPEPGFSYFLYQRDVPGAEEFQTTPLACLNGGMFDAQTGSCDCSYSPGYGGDLCQILLTSCQDLESFGVGQGHHPITTDLFGDGSSLVQTHCIISDFPTSWTLMRSSGRANTDLSWSDYVNGFRISDEDYWVGLENLHRFTSDGNSYRVRFGAFFNSTVDGYIFESSGNFVVGSASDGYAYSCDSQYYTASTVRLSGQTQYFSNLLYGHSGNRFSTVDNDQDSDSQRHCAQLAEAGWWFGSCQTFSINPLGWSYAALPGATTDSHIRVPGVDMSDASLAQSFQRVLLTLDLL